METFHLKIVLKPSVQPSLQENVIKHLLFSLKTLAKFNLKIHYTLSPHPFSNECTIYLHPIKIHINIRLLL